LQETVLFFFANEINQLSFRKSFIESYTQKPSRTFSFYSFKKKKLAKTKENPLKNLNILVSIKKFSFVVESFLGGVMKTLCLDQINLRLDSGMLELNVWIWTAGNDIHLLSRLWSALDVLKATGICWMNICQLCILLRRSLLEIF
jgi:hypothetical protein